MSRRSGCSDEDVLQLLTSLEATDYAVARSSVFDAIRYTPLQYAIRFSPSSVESLLAEGADAAAEPTLAYAAVCAASTNLIRLLSVNGADVNMKYEGRTALHWACYKCSYNTFCELVRCAGDKIDWDARTPEGQNALDLFEMGVSKGNAWDFTSEQINEFRSTLVSHMDPSQLRVVEDVPLDIPGAFPLDTES
ncbi:hypothetical protein BC629DRAFT_187349 [Irpex lacteus]|nr:hypothetical protein BC629DRAFT_187349 [Irpex lacteus]